MTPDEAAQLVSLLRRVEEARHFPTGPGGADVIEVMTVTSWPGWQQLLAEAPELEPVLARFGELVDPDSVTTILTRPSALPQEI